MNSKLTELNVQTSQTAVDVLVNPPVLSKARLPDAKFFQLAEDNGYQGTLVQVRRSRTGGGKSYHIVSSAAELAELVCKLPKQACVSLMAIGNHLEWEDYVYTPDENGDCRPGAY